MITVVLRGGLGNQMFEYAAGLNAALKSKKQLVLDTTFLNDRFPRSQFTYRTYDLDVFAIKPKFTALSKISSAIPIPGLWLGLDLVWNEVKKIMAGRHDAVRWDYFQSEKYFAENKDAVRAAFRFRNPLTGEAAKLAGEIKKTNSISLHVRRGDYKLPKYEKLYGATDTAYFDRAIAYMTERVDAPRFFVFSDDIAWCREHIKPAFPVTYVDDASKGPRSSFHLELMSLCKNNIITNSSFSWWGAWLNENPKKIVIAPRAWARGQQSDREGIIPSSWLAM